MTETILIKLSVLFLNIIKNKNNACLKLLLIILKKSSIISYWLIAMSQARLCITKILIKHVLKTFNSVITEEKRTGTDK